MPVTKFTPEIQTKVADRVRELAPGNKVTWSEIKAIAGRLGVDVTRQWLCKSEVIAAAYKDAVSVRREARTEGQSSAETTIASKLRAEIRLQRETITASEKRLIRYLYNARLLGITIEQLEAPVSYLEN